MEKLASMEGLVLYRLLFPSSTALFATKILPLEARETRGLLAKKKI